MKTPELSKKPNADADVCIFSEETGSLKGLDVPSESSPSIITSLFLLLLLPLSVVSPAEKYLFTPLGSPKYNRKKTVVPALMPTGRGVVP